jgi:hypothetical protein
MEVGGQRHVSAALPMGKDSTSHGRGDWTNPIDQLFLNRRAAARYRALVSIYRAVRGSPGICHFSFLSIFHE